jgi:hypothetical protein
VRPSAIVEAMIQDQMRKPMAPEEFESDLRGAVRICL